MPDSLNRIEKRAAISLAAIFGLRMLGLFMVMPVFMLYGAHYLESNAMLLGVAIGAYGLTQALLQIPMGIASDRWGRRRIIVSGLLLFIIGSVIAAASESIWGVILGRSLQGMGAIASAVLALASDVTREEHRSKVMAVIGMCIGLSFAVAMLLGPILADAFGIESVFWFTALGGLLGILIVWKGVPHSIQKIPNGDTVPVPRLLKEQLKNTQLLRLDISVFFLHMILTSLFVVLPLLLVDSGLESASHWKMYFPVLLASIGLMVPLFIMSGKGKEKTALLTAIALIIVSIVTLLISNSNLWMLVIAALIFFVGFNYMEATLPATLSRVVPAGEKGSAMGIFSTCQFMGAFVGGIVAGYTYQNWQVTGVFLTTLALGILWLIVSLSVKIPDKVKNFTLGIAEMDHNKAESLAQQLADLSGVKEAIIVVEDCVAYLKVEQNFDIRQAKSLINSF